MIQAFALTVMEDEAELQWLLQEVEAYRRKVPKFDKRSLVTLSCGQDIRGYFKHGH